MQNGNIDNLIIIDSGAGYVEVPTIRISGGGKNRPCGCSISD